MVSVAAIDRAGQADAHGSVVTLSAADSVSLYLLAAGDLPCFDCWEEYPGHVHEVSRI